MQFSAVLDPPGKAAGLDPRFSWCTVGVHVCFHDPVQLGLDHSIKTLLRVGPSLPLSEELKKKKKESGGQWHSNNTRLYGTYRTWESSRFTSGELHEHSGHAYTHDLGLT